MLLPTCEAVTVHVPVLAKLKVLPATVHTPVVLELKVMGNPEVAVAVKVGVEPEFCVPGLLKVMVCVA